MIAIPCEARAVVYVRARGRCEQCGELGRVDLHHLRRYTNDCEQLPIAGLESPADLAALCRDCHYANHRDPNGEYWWDVEEMAEHWHGWFDR